MKLRNKLDRESTAEHTVKILAKDKGSFSHCNTSIMHIFLKVQGQRPKIYKYIWCNHKREQARVNTVTTLGNIDLVLGTTFIWKQLI